MYHVQQKCTECTQMIQAAKLVLTHGLCPLSVVFKSSFSYVTYTSATAKCKLLQMPLAAITLGGPASGKSEVYLLEAVEGLDYPHLIKFLESKMCNGVFPGLNKKNKLVTYCRLYEVIESVKLFGTPSVRSLA